MMIMEVIYCCIAALAPARVCEALSGAGAGATTRLHVCLYYYMPLPLLPWSLTLLWFFVCLIKLDTLSLSLSVCLSV